jgi:hypothetical protein
LVKYVRKLIQTITLLLTLSKATPLSNDNRNIFPGKLDTMPGAWWALEAMVSSMCLSIPLLDAANFSYSFQKMLLSPSYECNDHSMK